nr:immunoglobulin heavy chain junction region [Mus musculus]
CARSYGSSFYWYFDVW